MIVSEDSWYTIYLEHIVVVLLQQCFPSISNQLQTERYLICQLLNVLWLGLKDIYILMEWKATKHFSR